MYYTLQVFCICLFVCVCTTKFCPSVHWDFHQIVPSVTFNVNLMEINLMNQDGSKSDGNFNSFRCTPKVFFLVCLCLFVTFFCSGTDDGPSVRTLRFPSDCAIGHV
jgi:hypothetical protein